MVDDVQPAPKARWILALAVAASFLVVIALTLVPIVAYRDDSRQGLCASRLKSLSSALLQYAEEADGRLPAGGAWMDQIASRIKNQANFHCPLLGHGPSDPYGFAMYRTLPGLDASTKPNHATQPLVFDATTDGRNGLADEDGLPTPGRHRGLNNIATLDGSLRAERR